MVALTQMTLLARRFQAIKVFPTTDGQKWPKLDLHHLKSAQFLLSRPCENNVKSCKTDQNYPSFSDRSP
jgi:hypothetical protein